MKSIFYRVWDTQENKYFEPTYEVLDGKLEDLHLGLGGDLFMRTMDGTIDCEKEFPGRFIVEKATHKIDKNNVVIHEGDKLKDNVDRWFVVEYREDLATFVFKYRGQKKSWLSYMQFKDVQKPLEIIGNIHTTGGD